MKILLTGASGLLGNAYAAAAIRRGHRVTAVYNQSKPIAAGIQQLLQIDLSQPEALSAACLQIWPDVIVNCAAISSPEQALANPTLAEKINVGLPRLLAQISTHIGARLIHISTDMVFDAASNAPFRSTDMPAPATLYGQTKLMAEREVLQHNQEDPVVLRIPILMGNSPSKRRSVHERLFAAIDAGLRPRIACDEIRQPTSADNVAEVLLELSERRDLHGIFHWAGAEHLSRLEMAQRILQHFGRRLDSIEAGTVADHSNSANNRPTELTFNLHPIVNKLKTRPASFQQQLDSLTARKPINA